MNPKLKADLSRHVLDAHRVRYGDGFKSCDDCGREFPCEQARALKALEDTDRELAEAMVSLDRIAPLVGVERVKAARADRETARAEAAEGALRKIAERKCSGGVPTDCLVAFKVGPANLWCPSCFARAALRGAK
jgi:hypothetical protein